MLSVLVLRSSPHPIPTLLVMTVRCYDAPPNYSLKYLQIISRVKATAPHRLSIQSHKKKCHVYGHYRRVACGLASTSISHAVRERKRKKRKSTDRKPTKNWNSHLQFCRFLKIKTWFLLCLVNKNSKFIKKRKKWINAIESRNIREPYFIWWESDFRFGTPRQDKKWNHRNYRNFKNTIFEKKKPKTIISRKFQIVEGMRPQERGSFRKCDPFFFIGDLIELNWVNFI